MSQKWKIINRITESGLVVVVRADNNETAKRIAAACLEGGAAAIEVTYTVPGATGVIEGLIKEYSGSIIIGAGTVLDPETARIAILAGAQYIVSPYLNCETVRMCNRYQVPCMPGIMTVKEAVEAMECGADILKLFPGEVFGPRMIRALKGPLPQANIMPTGGVSIDNVDEWIKAGAVALGVGGSLTAGAASGDYAGIARLASEFVARIRDARAEDGQTG